MVMVMEEKKTAVIRKNDGCLSYKGGDNAHVLHIGMSFKEFRNEVAKLFSGSIRSLSFTYLLPGNHKTLVKISSDYDLKRMIKFHVSPLKKKNPLFFTADILSH
ncbi:hypothetical protein TIFTF001_013323 [Ficus carica]|uniref:PB1 domain-containing protein n=1 Tax=Ficus carica TaxID=3494 RepID=A0AA88A1W6_FICCA|nr:hypothetical protein TIFTF001_013323 [Ficus carica]